ncbi:GTA glutaminase A [Piedraia hortae CBS 480.64]|uniref:GTA glutaminase A n=1 Tax=Piedraia hortae CBS 480.64 TaxID=1314780 RepID=A0A6A7C3N1_9PEZI|nr:GTA glutaminase A [Piedraia hortae CBS 480.64]
MRLSSLVYAAGLAVVQADFVPLRPPSFPLAVRSPYFHTWLPAGSDQGNGGYLAGEWPIFWHGQIVGWQGLVSVDNTTYTWLGKAPENVDLANQTRAEYTSTRSIFTLTAGPVELTATFLSPVHADDMKRASLPVSYLDVAVRSLDGKEHQVHLYTDISAEWVSGDHGAIAEWNYHTSGNIAYHKVYRQQQLQFSETDDQANWGNWYYTTANTNKVTHRSGADTDVRGQFINKGILDNSADTKYRAINNRWPVMGFAVDLGRVAKSSVNTVFQLSLHQDQCIQFQGAKDYTPLPCLWKSYFSNDVDAVSYFFGEYQQESVIATQVDSQISKDSIAADGQDYLSMTSLATRQAFASLEWTNTPGTPYLFMKEIASDGNMNTVDVIFPFHVMSLYMNATILKLLLDPLFIQQENGHWPKKYAVHDIGSQFPNATGHPDGNSEDMPVEECGDMIIMMLAHAQRTNDNSYLSQHYNILKQWNEYLVEDTLIPNNQLSTDDFAGPLVNQTNLALKGIIGIEAMSRIANLTNHASDAANFTKIAHNYISKWRQYGFTDSTPTTLAHSRLNYNDPQSHGILYSLYHDALLGLNLVPREVFSMQSNFYPTLFNTYGVPLDTRHGYTKIDWELHAAAVASESTSKMFMQTLRKYVAETKVGFGFPDLYETDTAELPAGISFITRPVIGGVFAQLALEGRGFVRPG